MAWPTAAGRFDLGDVALGSGEVLPGAFITWRSHGTLELDRSNAVVFPTSYSVPDMCGNGAAASPANTPG